MAHTSTPDDNTATSSPLESEWIFRAYIDLARKRGDFGFDRLWPHPIYDTPSAPAPAEPLFPPEDARSEELWYPDGNVIVKVEGTYFKLFQSRLQRHCEYFKRIFEDGVAAVVDVQDVTLQDFETLLRYLEIPGYDAPYEAAVSLLRAAHVLGCKLISNLAEKRVVGPWSSTAPPSDDDNLADRPYQEGIELLSLARELGLPHAVRKQALYALLASDVLWSDVEDPKRRAAVDISDCDLLLLYRARSAMQEKWRRQYLAPPSMCHTEGCCEDRDEDARRVRWYGEFAAVTVEEARDPLRAADRMQQYVRTLTGWCQSCIEDRADAWREVRTVWWEELDKLLFCRVERSRQLLSSYFHYWTARQHFDVYSPIGRSRIQARVFRHIVPEDKVISYHLLSHSTAEAIGQAVTNNFMLLSHVIGHLIEQKFATFQGMVDDGFPNEASSWDISHHVDVPGCARVIIRASTSTSAQTAHNARDSPAAPPTMPSSNATHSERVSDQLETRALPQPDPETTASHSLPILPTHTKTISAPPLYP
ncbi:hypothetical protein C8T65DRAFT_745087 [Cerioporus squamosus]|nr:hypothetical protein C8T65DRAFT_745087 [Cerioporus squamosus]